MSQDIAAPGASKPHPPQGEGAGEIQAASAAGPKQADATTSPDETKMKSAFVTVMLALAGLYYVITTQSTATIQKILNNDAALLAMYASESQGACSSSLSYYNTLEQQVEIKEQSAQTEFSAITNAANQTAVMMTQMTNIYTQMLGTAARSLTSG